MKYYFSILFLLFSLNTLQAQIVNIPDADFKDYLLFLGDLNNDGEIQVSEAELFTEIIINSNGYNSLEGINSFVNLESLDCSDNPINTLEISGLVNLKLLRCGSTQLTNLDVSNLINLEELNFSHNQITNIDLSNLASLKILVCRYNQLTHLDINNLSELEILSCEVNEILNLNVSNLLNLVSLACSSNEIFNLDLLNLPSLINLNCDFNSISTLNTNSAPNLEVLYYALNEINELDFTNLTSLKRLSCIGNEISNLDISNLTNLEKLYCGYNQLIDLDVSNSSLLNYLDCDGNPLETLNIKNQASEELYVDYSVLEYVCADEWEVANIQNEVSASCVVESNCNLGINDNILSTIDVSIYPNPVIESITIKSEYEFNSVSIYSVNGILFKQISLLSYIKEMQLDLENLSSGLYFIKLTSLNKKTSVKFIKQ